MTDTVALIPARAGSKRVRGKNTRLLLGQPLIAYTIAAAIESGEFDSVLVSSDDAQTLELASRCGADTLRRPSDIATDTSPDIEWVSHALKALSLKRDCSTFSILRPTSPFRSANTIQRAISQWNEFKRKGYTSLRAVEAVTQHPAKMWRLHARELVPLLPQPAPLPWHDSQHPSLPPVYVQNASLEISLVNTVETTRTISGGRVLPFLTKGYEGFDINSAIDWSVAELLVTSGQTGLPNIENGQ